MMNTQDDTNESGYVSLIEVMTVEMTHTLNNDKC